MVKTHKVWNYGNLRGLGSSDVDAKIYKGSQTGNILKRMKFSPVYGPIISRRSGLSLGINPIQGGFACNWDCNYCQYGKQDIANGKVRFTKPEEIEKALEQRIPKVLEILGKQDNTYDRSLSLTICGPTEPTISPYFNEIVDVVNRIRDKHNKRYKIHTDLYTNCTNLTDRNIAPIDRVFMKLDAGNQETFKRINRPRGRLTLEKVVRQIKEANVKHKILQTILIDGPDGNIKPKDIEDYLTKLREIQPSEVQLYTILYKPRDFDINPTSEDKLKEIGERIEKSIPGKNVTIYLKPVEEGNQWLF